MAVLTSILVLSACNVNVQVPDVVVVPLPAPAATEFYGKLVEISGAGQLSSWTKGVTKLVLATGNPTAPVTDPTAGVLQTDTSLSDGAFRFDLPSTSDMVANSLPIKRLYESTVGASSPNCTGTVAATDETARVTLPFVRAQFTKDNNYTLVTPVRNLKTSETLTSLETYYIVYSDKSARVAGNVSCSTAAFKQTTGYDLNLNAGFNVMRASISIETVNQSTNTIYSVTTGSSKDLGATPYTAIFSGSAAINP